jgi:hypothetical protein
MSELNIDLGDSKTSYVPGETVRGAVQWNVPGNPQRFDLSLLWYTAGKGTRDVGVIETVAIDNPGSFGSQDYAFTLPYGPYSFSGKLISLIWVIELTCTPGQETVRQEITVSPTGREIVLGSRP